MNDPRTSLRAHPHRTPSASRHFAPRRVDSRVPQQQQQPRPRPQITPPATYTHPSDSAVTHSRSRIPPSPHLLMSRPPSLKRGASAAGLPTAGSHADAAHTKRAKIQLQRANSEQKTLAAKLGAASRRQQTTVSKTFKRTSNSAVGAVTSAAPAAAAPRLPAHWSQVNPTHGNKVFVQLDKVRHAMELAAVKKHWTDTGGDGKIVRVFRVQNESQYRRFVEAGAALLHSGKHAQLNVIAYHGTRANSPWRICESATGFDVRKAVTFPGWLWAATTASYSSKCYGHRTVTSELPFRSLQHRAASLPNYTGLRMVLRIKMHVDHTATLRKMPDGRVMPMFGPEVYTTDKSEHLMPEYLIVYTHGGTAARPVSAARPRA